jgi:acetyltransferase-like isoleucine patch superfamily enzyme
MNIFYRLICRIKRDFLFRRLHRWGGGGFADFSVEILNPENVCIGKNFQIRERVWIAAVTDHQGGSMQRGKIEIGDYVVLTRDCILASAYHIDIGNSVVFGPGVIVYDYNHCFNELNVSVMRQGVSGSPVKIGDYSWIGARAVILPGVTIGRNCIVGAGGIVTKSLPDNSIAVGNPAKVIGLRHEERK